MTQLPECQLCGARFRLKIAVPQLSHRTVEGTVTVLFADVVDQHVYSRPLNRSQIFDAFAFLNAAAGSQARRDLMQGYKMQASAFFARRLLNETTLNEQCGD